MLFDPTTYAPALVGYGSAQLDWASSQPLFRRGFVEKNPRYTITGTTCSTPISYGAGNRKIAGSALRLLGVSAGHNLASAALEQYLRRRWPDHPRAVGALLWVERLAFAGWQSYYRSKDHLRQWQSNERLNRQLGDR